MNKFFFQTKDTKENILKQLLCNYPYSQMSKFHSVTSHLFSPASCTLPNTGRTVESLWQCRLGLSCKHGPTHSIKHSPFGNRGWSGTWSESHCIKICLILGFILHDFSRCFDILECMPWMSPEISRQEMWPLRYLITSLFHIRQKDFIHHHSEK